jgi:ubiquinone/menaquinone biosynthesis C-methylase UbiE
MDGPSAPQSSPPPKDACRNFYDSLNQYLDTTVFGPFSYFLNYGYIPNGAEEMARFEPNARELNGASLKLALEVVADCDLGNRSLLDVSCGRGGFIDVARRFFRLKRAVGVDISSSAIEFNRRTHIGSDVEFVVGDAEDLPFDTSTFDVVINIEASHAYPDLYAFYREVARVLVPGGHFLYADVLPSEVFASSAMYTSGIALLPESNRDITPNVLLACDAVSSQRMEIFASQMKTTDAAKFIGLPGSNVYERMRDGSMEYRIVKFRNAKPY